MSETLVFSIPLFYLRVARPMSKGEERPIEEQGDLTE